MRQFWRRRNDDLSALEARLHDERPQPSEALVRQVKDRATGGRYRPAPRLRLSFATLLSAAALATVIAVGGVGGFDRPAGLSHRAADAQYGETVTICHRTSRKDPGQTLVLSPEDAANHLQNHKYDTQGPCKKKK